MSAMSRVTLPDGSAREVARGTTPAQIAADIGPGLAKAALAAKVDGEVRDILRPLDADTNLALITSRDEADEYLKPDTTVEGLAKLRPAFLRDGGTVTAGNASGINDGAAALVLMTDENAACRGVTPLARIASRATAGVDPTVMGTGPIPASRSEEHTSELQSLMRISYAVFCLKKKNTIQRKQPAYDTTNQRYGYHTHS